MFFSCESASLISDQHLGEGQSAAAQPGKTWLFYDVGGSKGQRGNPILFSIPHNSHPYIQPVLQPLGHPILTMVCIITLPVDFPR